MILNISHDDKRKYRESLKKGKTARARTNRTKLLSGKIKDEAFKQLDQLTVDPKNNKGADVEIDEHMKMNDNYMRTGPYRPKKK